MTTQKNDSKTTVLPAEISRILEQIEAVSSQKPPVLPSIADDDAAAVRRIVLDAANFGAADCE